MRYLNKIAHLMGKFLYPLKANSGFFVFMFILAVVSALCVLPDHRGNNSPEFMYAELFFDLYLLCCILALIPLKARRVVRGILYFVFYFTSLADIYCYVNFSSTLNPSILMLVGETNGREAGEAISSLFSFSVIFSKVGWVLLLILIHVLYACRRFILKLLPVNMKVFPTRWRRDLNMGKPVIYPVVGTVVLLLFIWCGQISSTNQKEILHLFSGNSIGQVEHTLTESHHAQLYTPFSRLVFSLYANHLAGKQLGQLLEASKDVKIDSCSFDSPNIVLIIGESYGKVHSQLDGYFMPTTPRQVALRKSGLLVNYDDVVSCWNLTSYVFKNVFSMHVIGEKGEWCDYPLFPQIFRKSGYHVTFLTNQFLPKAHEEVYDFSGGFFLNHPDLSHQEFDTRNTELHQYDSGLLEDYDNNLKERKFNFDPKNPKQLSHNLIIFHLIGQHVSYKDRYPQNQTHFFASQYDDVRSDLTPKQRKMLSYYDNACLYNDSIVNQIVRRFAHQNAIVIYMPDHGEECYEGSRGFICRNHSAVIDWPLAHYEFEIPFWIYCSKEYIRHNPEMFQAVIEARHRKFMTDALPHMLLYLAGIHTKYYHAKYNLLSPEYDENRPRILKNTTDYDKLRRNRPMNDRKE
ncbi:MAG: phosphoethanolamine transferase [Prevotella sp.]|jgi:heptose-I-phosphate ethanolaminephosphotransferase|nr:phosphoethanolamine transferase [Prevotella sp.]MCH3995194.1 phosphoethanolamine transferase [Prevotella sp.]MCI1246032.1 phosphoethanolamine transferase [Prevotella sp.]